MGKGSTPSETIAGLLFESDGPDDEVLVHLKREATTRAELVASAEALKDGLLAAGVPPRAGVGVMLPNAATTVAAMFAVAAADAVYVPLNPRLSGPELATILATVQPAIVVTDHVERVPIGTAIAQPRSDGSWSITGLADASAPRFDDDVAFVQFTSGTTRRPNPVPLRASTLLSLMDGVVSKLRGSGSSSNVPARPPMPNLVPLSLSLWAGIYNVLFAFRVGAPVVLMANFEPTEFARLVAEFKIRSVVLPPAALTMLVDDINITTLTPLKIVRSVSAPLSPLQARRFRDRYHAVVLNGYGQTELGGEVIGWSAADAREHGEDKLGAIGRPHEGVELRIEGRGPHDHDYVGELWIRTPATAAGVTDPALADRMSADGYLRTGDLARIDDAGFVWIEGRMSDMINRGGLKVFPAEVAEVLLLHPLVRDAAVVGVPDDRLGEVPWAFVVTEGSVDPALLEEQCREHLAPYKVPARFVMVDELPRNEVGKVQPGRLVELAAAERTA